MSREFRFASFGVSAAVLFIAAHALPSADASIVVGSPNLPPESGIFASTDLLAARYVGPGIDIMLKCLTHRVIPGTVIRSSPGFDQIESFGTELLAVVTATTPSGSIANVPFQAFGQTSTIAFGWPTPLPATVPIEIVSMSLISVSPITGILIRESPTLSSQGQTSVESVGSGQFEIASFFDVFTEISLDNGSNWIPATGPTRLELLPAPPGWVPEPSSIASWSVLGMLLCGCRLRRRWPFGRSD